jgi:hypothetical protein
LSGDFPHNAKGGRSTCSSVLTFGRLFLISPFPFSLQMWVAGHGTARNLAEPFHCPPSIWVLAVAQVAGFDAAWFRGKPGRGREPIAGARGKCLAEVGYEILRPPMGRAILPGRIVAPGRRHCTRSAKTSNNRNAFSLGRGKAASIVDANVWSPRATATDGVWQAGSSTLSRNGLRSTTRFTG